MQEQNILNGQDTSAVMSVAGGGVLSYTAHDTQGTFWNAILDLFKIQQQCTSKELKCKCKLLNLKTCIYNCAHTKTLHSPAGM